MQRPGSDHTRPASMPSPGPRSSLYFTHFTVRGHGPNAQSRECALMFHVHVVIVVAVACMHLHTHACAVAPLHLTKGSAHTDTHAHTHRCNHNCRHRHQKLNCVLANTLAWEIAHSSRPRLRTCAYKHTHMHTVQGTPPHLTQGSCTHAHTHAHTRCVLPSQFAWGSHTAHANAHVHAHTYTRHKWPLPTSHGAGAGQWP